jgi:hypothetical protein
MRRFRNIPTHSICRFVSFAAVLAYTLTLVAQKSPQASQPKYDVRTETKMKGIVEEINLPPKGSEKDVAHLRVKSGTDSTGCFLCPKTFLDDMGMNLAKQSNDFAWVRSIRGDLQMQLCRVTVLDRPSKWPEQHKLVATNTLLSPTILKA